MESNGAYRRVNSSILVGIFYCYRPVKPSPVAAATTATAATMPSHIDRTAPPPS